MSPTGAGPADGDPGGSTLGEDTPAIAGVGAYAPRGRLPASAIEEAWGSLSASGIESVAVPAADEDPVTMATVAARRALSAAGESGADLEFLALAASTPPLAEEELVARVGSVLGAPAGATRHSFGASTRAGTRALRAALDADRTPALVVAADAPRGEPADAVGQAAGAGAAALVLTDDAPGRIEGFAEYAEPYPGTRFRESGDEHTRGLGVTGYDREAFGATLAGAVKRLGSPEVEAAALQAPDGALPYRAAGRLEFDAEQVRAGTTVHRLGDTGAASVPLGIARALASGHERVLAAAYGSGAGADALVVEGEVPVDLAPTVPGSNASDGEDTEGDGTDGEDEAESDAAATVEVGYAEALRRRGEITPDPPEGGGAYVSVPSWRRTLDQRHRLVAGRCRECGELAFPPEGACPACSALVEYERVQLPGTGTVEAVTTIGQGGAPPEFAPQQARGGSFGVCVVAFDGPDGGSVSAPQQVAGDRPTPSVGDRVRATIRRVYTQEGVTRYGTKVRPLDR